ncbi:putative mucin/carbohydrate-binding domain-containing protein [uncultured Romboutsia sp.]|uniref:putative mucin/carbohydrate-binding domain-containing protein n=1 Tax=uncultured Romboutsia sp. TaxID=1505656 RepID=UPI00266C46FF|nr:putative mucin/carbohydrate-binding domain-containing protein [uncultured Romboutsia sp.]
MKRKLISYICLVAIFMETIPVNALSNITSEIVPIESSEETKSEEESTEQKDEKTEEKEDKQKEESKSKLEDNVFNMYILDKIENELGFSIGFDEKEKKFKLSNQSEKQLSKTNLDSIIYKINIYDKENKEKLNIELLGKDTGNSEKLNILKDTKYETGDTIKIASFDPKKGIKILGEIKGDINKEKQTDKENEKVEDYSDGVDNLDYIENVRFKITETNLETVYNNAPVFEGLTDLLDVEDPSVDVLQGIKVTDDHDGVIDNSKIVVSVQEKTESSAILNYTVEDSWGRSITATRNIAAKDSQDAVSIEENQRTSNENELANNVITVDGIPYFGTNIERFKIKFDLSTKSIKVTDQDGRMLTNSSKEEYFKFVLYDKDMNEKVSATLLGSDKSDSENLDAINNYLFEEGDYIGIWHAESDKKLKIAGTIKGTTKNSNPKEAVVNDTVKDYANGVPQATISERRFRIKNTGLEEVNNDAPVIGDLESLTVPRGSDEDILSGVKEKINDDFDEFNDSNIEDGYVSIKHSSFDNTKVGDQTVTYTATDKWGRSSTKDRIITVTSTNPLDTTYIDFMDPNNSKERLFRIGLDTVEKTLIVDGLENLSDKAIDETKSSPIFKLKVYSNNGILQKTLNIKGSDKLRTILKRINGYKYTEGDRIELWSTTPENIRITGKLVEKNKNYTEGSSTEETNEKYIDYEVNESTNSDVYKEDYTNGINNPDYMKNVRFEIGKSELIYIYNQAPQFKITKDLIVKRNGEVDLTDGISVTDDHDSEINKTMTHGTIDTSTIGKKYVEYKAVDSWGRSTIIKREITVYPYNNLEYNYITLKNNQTGKTILSIRFDDNSKTFNVYKSDASNIPSNLDSNNTLLEIKLIKKNRNLISRLFKSSESENEKTITITKQDLISNNIESKFSNVVYAHGDYLSLKPYDYSKGLTISAKSKNPFSGEEKDDKMKKSDILFDGYEDEDEMENSRFEIHPEGLEMIYNEALKIHGIDSTLYLYKGDKLTLEKAREGISATDDLDGNISKDQIDVKYFNYNGQTQDLSHADTNSIGEFLLAYIATDSWGKSVLVTRTVSIISKSVSNDIEFYDKSGNNKLFSFKYNPKINEFNVTKGIENIPNNPPTETEPERPEPEQPGESQEPENGVQNPSQDEELAQSYTTESNPGSEGEVDGDGSDSTTDTEQPPSDDEVTEEPDLDIDSDMQVTPEESKPEIIFRLKVFNTKGKLVGTVELSDDEEFNNEELKKLNDIGIYDDYYFSVWSKTPSRIKIKGNISNTDKLGESGSENENYSDGIDNEDHMNNVRFKLSTDGLEAVYNKAPKIIIKSKEVLTQYAGDTIDYTQGVEVIDDHDETIPIENIKVSFGKKDNDEEKTENDLIIGTNIINLSVEDSWGRESTITRKLVITNGIDKNRISFKGTDGEVIGIGFDHANNRLVISNENKAFGEGNVSGYVRIAIKRDENTYAVGPVGFNVSEDFSNKSVSNKLQPLRNYQLNYGDKLEIYHGHPIRFLINGKVIDAREDYEDGVDNPENLINTTFEITKSGLKAIYTNPDTSNITENKVVFGPMAPEKFPVKIQIDFSERKFKVLERTTTKFLNGDNDNVYRMVLIGSDGRIKRDSSFSGDRYADTINESEFWHNQRFNYNDCLYIWHKDPKRSIIKGNIINKREDYEDGVDNPDNMNNVVFKLTREGVEAVYNEAPVFEGVENTDVYKGETFNPLQGVKVTDDFDTDHLSSITVGINGQTTRVTTTSNGTVLTPNSISFDTSTPGEKTITYTAIDRWGKTKTVERKVTVRPNLYKNVFKVYADTIQSEIPEENIVSESESTEDDRTPLFEIGFDSVTGRYRVFNQTNDRIAPNNPSEMVFGIQIIGSNKELKNEITLTGNDRGNSPKLDELNNTEYGEGDIIRVYRSDLNSIKIIGTVTGDIPHKEDISDEIKKFDYMTNTGFKISNDGLEAVYNAAPDINGNIEDKTISKGSNINLLEGLTASDDHDTQLSKRNIKVYVDESLVNGNSVENSANYTFDSIGKYTVHYYINDSWGRATIREQTITVESKVRENEIEVYGPNQDLAFKVTFNTTNNQIVLKANETPTASGSSTSQDRYFEMVVRNIKGEEKYRVTLNGDRAHDTEQLAKIHEAAFNKYDTISLYGKTENTVKIIGGVIQESNKNTKINNNNYENGFGEISRYPLVRFKITDDGLKEITQKEMLISGLDNKTIKRGEEVDYLSGVLVNLQDINNEDYKITVNEEDKRNLNNLKEGNYHVRYTISNSWGTQKEQTRTITVEPRTKLEENKLSVKNNNDEVIMIIGFDSIQRKLRVIDYTPNSTIDSNNGKLAFVINAYDSLGNTIGTIELKGTEIISEDIVTRLNNFPYVEGYRLSIWAKDESKHLVLDGDVKSGNKNTEKALKRNSNITPTDKMENGRFEILDDGLVYYYNQAPKIHGGDNELVYYKGSILTLPDDISVTDDYDQISANQVVINDDKVDYDTLGRQDITYIVEDSWGRVTEKPAKIHVMSSIDKNEFNIFPMNVNDTVGQYKAFSIQFVREDGKNKIHIGNQNSSFDFYPSNSGKNKTEKTFMTISIYNKNNTLKQSFELLGNENAINSNGLRNLNGYEFEFGDYIAIEGLTEASKKCARINGTVVNAKESYVNGVENIDNIQHVRFKFTDVGLESVYNEAPKITIDKTIDLSTVKGDDIPYMRGVKLKDDHDKLTQANVEVTWNPNETTTEEYEPYNDVIKGVAKVGKNVLHYKVTDSWGRTCEGERTINLSNGILDNSIVFKGGRDRKDLIKFTFVKCTDNRNNGVTLKVDILDGDTIFAENAMSYYYTVKVTIPGGNSYIRKIYSDYSYNNQNRRNGPGHDPFGIFRDLYLPYGSTFEFIDTGHPFNLSIHGRVRSQREDYSDGVQNPDNLRSIKFMVTDSGFKSVYVEKDDIKTNQNIISVVSTEGIPLQLKIDPETKKISGYSNSSSTFYWDLGERTKVFNITLTGQNGGQKFSIDGYSREKGNAFSNTHFSRPRDYEIGDKLTIWHYTPNRVSIKGPIENQREDYSDGIDNEKNLTEAVFTLTENGLEAVYKEAPKITGIKDTKILKGGSLDLDNLIDELEAKDTIDGKYEDKVIIGDATQFRSVPSDIRIIDPKSVNTISETTARRGTLLIDLTSIDTDQVGMYEVSYRVTNSNDRTTRKSSTIVVYDKPTITESSLSRIELNSVEHTEEAIINRLKEAVIVSDDDDTLYKKTTKLEVLKQNVNPNEEGIYNVDYKATDLYGEETVKTIPIQVSRTINVSVPTTIPFQVVTNLKDKTTDEFISGVMKVQNNNTSDVNVYIQSFTRQESSFTTKTRSYKNLEIVQPSEFEDWNSLSSEDTMTKMALGIYNKEGLIVDRNLQLTKESPLWLYEDISNVKLGVLNRAQNLANPYTSKLSFTSKHGKNFIGGTSRSKFNLVFRFE